MAGFRRLCGRFRCVAGPTAQNGAEGAKFKRLRRLWGIVLVGRQGEGEQIVARPCTGMIRGGRRSVLRCLQAYLRALGAGCARGVKTGVGSDRNCVRFVLKMGLVFQLDIQLGTHTHPHSRPHKDKNFEKYGDF